MKSGRERRRQFRLDLREQMEASLAVRVAVLGFVVWELALGYAVVAIIAFRPKAMALLIFVFVCFILLSVDLFVSEVEALKKRRAADAEQVRLTYPAKPTGR